MSNLNSAICLFCCSALKRSVHPKPCFRFFLQIGESISDIFYLSGTLLVNYFCFNSLVLSLTVGLIEGILFSHIDFWKFNTQDFQLDRYRQVNQCYDRCPSMFFCLPLHQLWVQDCVYGHFQFVYPLVELDRLVSFFNRCSWSREEEMAS